MRRLLSRRSSTMRSSTRFSTSVAGKESKNPAEQKSLVLVLGVLPELGLIELLGRLIDDVGGKGGIHLLLRNHPLGEIDDGDGPSEGAVVELVDGRRNEFTETIVEFGRILGEVHHLVHGLCGAGQGRALVRLR